MAWIILEGLDRTGKSTVSEFFQKQGYIVHHMNAPDKKYMKPGYVGPSYFEEVVDMYMGYDGKNVIFDRSPYGEIVWPKVYGREPQLSDEDFEFLREYEDKNDTVRILMHDDNKEAHWKRCVDNNEPLTRGQFNAAIEFFNSMGAQQGFTKKTLVEFQRENPGSVNSGSQQKLPETLPTPQQHAAPAAQVQAAPAGATKGQPAQTTTKVADPIDKLERANAINKVLSKRLIKYDEPIYEELENDIREFLKNKLDQLFGNDPVSKTFDELDLQILKRYCASVKTKLEAK